MKTIFKDDSIEIEVVTIENSNNLLYAVFHVHNLMTHSIVFSVNSRSESDCSFLYNSKITGVHDYMGVYPHSIEFEIPRGSFKEVQLVYESSSINEGDEFDALFSFRHCSSACPLFHFKCFGNYWELSTAPRYASILDANYEKYKDLKVQMKYINQDKKDEGEVIDKPMLALESLIGLESVKDEVRSLANFVRIQEMRKANGLPSSSISYHCVFTGNPGTGKTTVARIVASIYKELGILKKGHLVETDRSGLVGNYVGHTATKTNEIIDSALDGVLFIDEAYALASNESKNDFGPEAVATLLKRMEDNRDRLIVIVAGYTKEMKSFINSNSGLKSRFVRYIDFPDYSIHELCEIFCRFTNNGGYILEDSAHSFLESIFDSVISLKDRDYGNGRYARNLYEETIKAQANRLSLLSEINTEDLQVIRSEDIAKALEKTRTTIPG